MKNALALLAFCLLLAPALAQELNCSVKVNAQKLTTADPRVFQTLEQSVSEFMNSTKWTDDYFQTDERINCNLVLTVEEDEKIPGVFRASLAIQVARPVYNSTYETALFNHVDKEVKFTYEQYQPLLFSRNAFNDNLSAVLAFYAYIIVGLDYDSFARLGGDPYFRTAQEILNTVPASAASQFGGWNSLDGNRNRYWLVENLLSPRVRPLREAWYEYHLHGLDRMADEAAAGRAVIAAAIDEVAKVNQSYPNSMIVQLFNNTKGKEIIEVFKLASPAEKDKVIQVMSRVDATNASQYRSIR